MSEPWRMASERDMMNTFGPSRGMIVRGDGPLVEDEHGTTRLDFLAGIAVNALGHAHPAFVEAVSRQAALAAHVSNLFTSPPQLELAARLKRLAGTGESGRVFFANSGAEANEAALKLARLNGGGTRTRILALDQAFHGRTMGALALTGKPAMREPFEPGVPGVTHIPATIEALEAELGDTVQALIVEPIQGEAGVRELPAGYLARARELCDRAGALLILDEVQTGAGRTGTWFAFQHDGVAPDAMTLAKGIGGGVPIGALVTFGSASGLLGPGQHGTTFGGNPLATAAANAVLGVIEDERVLDNVMERSAQLVDGIRAIGSPLVTEVRGRGLLLGIGLAEPVAAALQAAAFDAGLIVNAPNPETIRLAPPLIITSEHAAAALDILDRVLGAAATKGHDE